MKKVLAMILSIGLICVCAGAGAVTYTLPEKLSRQLQIGSGLKGSFVLNAAGVSEPAVTLSVFNNAEIQIRGMASDKDWHYYFYQTDEAENQWARTDLQRRDGAIYLKSDLLSADTILMVPEIEVTLDALTRKEGQNPSIGSAIWNLTRMSDGMREEVWKPLVAQLEERLETWLTPYAMEPSQRQDENGQTVIELSYVIPMDSLKQGILDGLELITGNPEIMAMAGDLTTEEQRETYLNPYLRYYYEAALDAMDLNFDVSLSRTVSTLGATISSAIELPLDEGKTGYSALILETEGDTQRYTLSRADREMTVVWPAGSLKEDGAFSLWFIDKREDGEPSTAQRIDLTRTEDSWEDEESRSHERYTYTIGITRDVSRIGKDELAENYGETLERHGEATLHFYSKYAQSSPTTLEMSASWQEEGLTLTLTGKIKSASPWIYSPFEIINPRNVLEMKSEDWVIFGAEAMAGAAEQLKPNALTEAAEPAETPSPTATPMIAEIPEEEAEEPSETATNAATEDAETAAQKEAESTEDEAASTETAALEEPGDNSETAEATEEPGESMEEAETAETPAPEGIGETEIAEEEEAEPEEIDTSDWPDLTASPESDG